MGLGLGISYTAFDETLGIRPEQESWWTLFDGAAQEGKQTTTSTAECSSSSATVPSSSLVRHEISETIYQQMLTKLREKRKGQCVFSDEDFGKLITAYEQVGHDPIWHRKIVPILNKENIFKTLKGTIITDQWVCTTFRNWATPPKPAVEIVRVMDPRFKRMPLQNKYWLTLAMMQLANKREKLLSKEDYSKFYQAYSAYGNTEAYREKIAEVLNAVRVVRKDGKAFTSMWVGNTINNIRRDFSEQIMDMCAARAQSRRYPSV